MTTTMTYSKDPITGEKTAILRPWTQEEIDAHARGRAAQAPAEVRTERNAKLRDSDWTQVADAPVNQSAWAAYRQELRDVPEQAEFPNTVVWPTEPS
jgi:hypothetical protein